MRSLILKLTARHHRARAASWKRRISRLRLELSDTIWSENKRIAWYERRMARHLEQLRTLAPDK